jgi:hypothetical protein
LVELALAETAAGHRTSGNDAASAAIGAWLHPELRHNGQSQRATGYEGRYAHDPPIPHQP